MRFTVHVEEPRCFRGRVYIDEFADCVDAANFTRGSTWTSRSLLLRNLFAGLSRPRATAPRLGRQRRYSVATGDTRLGQDRACTEEWSFHTGMTMGLATPAKTPALTASTSNALYLGLAQKKLLAADLAIAPLCRRQRR